MCLTLHLVPFSLLRLRHLNLRTPVSPALPLDHICFMILHNLHLQSLVLYFQWVLPNVLPLASLVIREVTDSWDCWRHWGLKKLCACVLHLAWKRTISTRDRISFHHHCHRHCHHHHLQIVYRQRFTAQDWGRWEGEQHIIIEEEERQRCRHRQQREGAGVGDGDGDGEGGEGVQTGSTVWYDRRNRFLISPIIHNLSLLSWPTNKKSLNGYCSSVTLALSRSWSKKCDAGRERERTGHSLTSRLVETAEPHEYFQRLESPSTDSEYTSSEMFGEADSRTGWKTDGKG